MYPAGPSAIWIEAALAQLRAAGERIVLHDGVESATARELVAESGALAVAWFRLGLRPGDRLLLALQSSRRFVTQLLAAARAGLIVVPLHPQMRPRQLAHVVWDAGPRAALADEPLADLIRVSHPQVRVVDAARLEAEAAAARGEIGEESAGVSLALDHAGVSAGAADPALLLYTSGTTGKPKGALHTHGSIGSNLAALADAWQLTPGDRLLHCLPLHHLHGLVVGVMGALQCGVTLDLCARFEAREVVARLASGGATLFFGVPSMYARLVEVEAPPLPAMRLFVSGSAPLPPALKRRVAERFGHAIVERYGATEMGIALAQRADDAARPAGSVGMPLAGVEWKLVREEGDGRRVEESTEGELWVRGPSLFEGYFDDDEATAQVRIDGWYRTGDLVRRSADGTFAIVGRLATDLIKVHGHRVGALEIEACLADHPGVAEVAVVGRPDAVSGEAPIAYVRPRDVSLTTDALLAHARAQLAPYQVPRRIVLMDELPHTGPGKVDKKALP